MTCGCGGGFGGTPGSASLSGSRVLQWNPQPNNAAAVLADGVNTTTFTGTAVARTVAVVAGDLLQATPRIGLTPAAAAVDSVGGARAANSTVVNGSAAIPASGTPIGRWRNVFDFGISDAVLNPEARMFVGMQGNTAAPTAVNPTTLANLIGFGQKSGDANLHFFATDNVINVTDVDLGAAFVIGIGSMFRIAIGCLGTQTAGSQSFQVQAVNLLTGARFALAVSPAQAGPLALSIMSPRIWRSTGPVNAALTGIDLAWMTLTIDY